MIVRRADGQILHANDMLQLMLGADGELIVGREMYDFCADPDEGAMLLDNLRDAGRTDEFEIQIRQGDGGLVWGGGNAAPIAFDEAEACLVTVGDIEARRRAEKTLAEAAAEFVDMGAFPEMNPGPVLRVDRAATVVLGTMAWPELVQDLPRLTSAARARLATNGSTHHPALWTDKRLYRPAADRGHGDRRARAVLRARRPARRSAITSGGWSTVLAEGLTVSASSCGKRAEPAAIH